MDRLNRLTNVLTPPQTKTPPSRWAPERRLEFIDFRLRWDGTINRSELVDFFGISIQQASYDLARYAELAPGNLMYDKSAKTYRVAPGFTPLIIQGDSQYYLSQLAELATGAEPPSSLFIGWRPPCDVVRYPTRPVQTTTLLRLLWAMRDHEDLQIVYQSMRRSSATERWIAPHALASDGFRWHVRAWCHERGDFRDFVLSRIQSVAAARPTTVDSATDDGWHTRIDIVVRPRAGLSEGQRSAIEIDFGMRQGRLLLNCRKALAFYALRQLQLDRPTNAPIAEQPLELENPDALSGLLSVARKVPESAPALPVSPQES